MMEILFWYKNVFNFSDFSQNTITSAYKIQNICFYFFKYRYQVVSLCGKILIVLLSYVHNGVISDISKCLFERKLVNIKFYLDTIMIKDYEKMRFAYSYSIICV